MFRIGGALAEIHTWYLLITNYILFPLYLT